LPSVQQLKGFKGVRLLVDRTNNKVVSMGLWETEADFQTSIAWNQGQIDKFADLIAARPEIGGYEVVLEM
jgi:heme-degrading monooxygenase HmoA